MNTSNVLMHWFTCLCCDNNVSVALIVGVVVGVALVIVGVSVGLVCKKKYNSKIKPR